MIIIQLTYEQLCFCNRNLFNLLWRLVKSMEGKVFIWQVTWIFRTSFFLSFWSFPCFTCNTSHSIWVWGKAKKNHINGNVKFPLGSSWKDWLNIGCGDGCPIGGGFRHLVALPQNEVEVDTVPVVHVVLQLLVVVDVVGRQDRVGLRIEPLHWNTWSWHHIKHSESVVKLRKFTKRRRIVV